MAPIKKENCLGILRMDLKKVAYDKLIYHLNPADHNKPNRGYSEFEIANHAIDAALEGANVTELKNALVEPSQDQIMDEGNRLSFRKIQYLDARAKIAS